MYNFKREEVSFLEREREREREKESFPYPSPSQVTKIELFGETRVNGSMF